MEYIKLKDLFTIKKGTKIEEVEKSENTIRYLQIGDLRNDDNLKYCYENEKYIIANKSDIIIAWDGANAGTIGFRKYGAIGSTLALLKIKDENYSSIYCGMFLKSKFKYLRDNCTGATIPHISRSSLENLEIPNLTLYEQNKVVEVLYKGEELINKRKEQIKSLDELVKSKFIEMFGDKSEYVSVSYYIDSLLAGKSLAGEEVCKNKVLKTGSVSYDYFNKLEVKNLPVNYQPNEQHLTKVGDLLVSRMNTAELVGATAYVWDIDSKTYIPDRLWKAIIKKNVNSIFLWQLLIQQKTKEQIRRAAAGTSGSMKNISKQSFLELKVIKVDYHEQNQFADFVQQVDKLKFEMENSLKELEDNFNSLMQKAFKGELFN